MRIIGATLFSLYAAFCLAMTLLLPANKFEWMLDDPEAKADGLTFCTLPLYDAWETRSVTFAILLPILICGAVMFLRKRKMHYSAWIALALLLTWVWRFFVHYPLCAGDPY